jgi:hypothetical protein
VTLRWEDSASSIYNPLVIRSSTAISSSTNLARNTQTSREGSVPLLEYHYHFPLMVSLLGLPLPLPLPQPLPLLLLQKGAKVDLKDVKDQTLISWAREHSSKAVTNLLQSTIAI